MAAQVVVMEMDVWEAARKAAQVLVMTLVQEVVQQVALLQRKLLAGNELSISLLLILINCKTIWVI